MKSLDQQIKDAFPFSTFREGQKEAIEKILKAFASGKKYVFFDGPVGTGKSAMGIAIARLQKTSFYITTTKTLQDQIMRDFSSLGVEDLKGRNSYECVAYDTFPELKVAKPQIYVNCAEGFCKRQGKSACDLCFPKNETSICPYFVQLDKASTAPITVMNFSSFFFQTMNKERFPDRDLIILDEAHNTESQVMNFVSISITDAVFTGVKIPETGSATDYAAWLRKEKIAEIATQKSKEAKKEGNIQESDEWEHLASKITNFLNEDPSEWVTEYSKILNKIEGSDFGKIELKPIFARRHAKKYIFNKAKKFLLMSATIISAEQMCDALGIDPREMEFIEMPSRFPVANRPIFFDSSIGSMSYRNKEATLPKMLKRIEEISKDHKDQKGIIHSHSFQVSDYIVNNASKDLRRRLCYQKNYVAREDTLKAHEISKNGILIGPAWHEGLDLKDDLARFAIICKVPYPNYTNNPQLKARMDLSQEYYDYLTALKLVQSYGRTIRSETDWAVTYVLDSDFARFMKGAGHFLPPWFTEAVEGL